MHAKYADIVESTEAIEFIHTLPAGMFDLPSGQSPVKAAAGRP
jgi:hypothetical protein